MKKLLVFIAGLIGGFIIAATIVYLAGYLIDFLGYQLYESEQDQQRNFNIAAFFCFLFSILSGFATLKISLTKQSI